MVDNYTVYIIKEEDRYDITDIVGDMSWGNSIDTLSTEFSFSVGRSNYDRYMTSIDIECGDQILVTNKDEQTFFGIITNKGKSYGSYSFSCYDFGFYLNKSETVIQFKKTTVSDAIKQLCSRFDIEVNTPNILTQISKLYADTVVSDIINDLLIQVKDETGNKYNFEMHGDKLYVYEYGSLVIKAVYRPVIAEFDATNRIGSDYSYSESIEDMKNKIIITSDNGKGMSAVAEKQDSDSICRYGLLQVVESVDDKDIAQARNIAKNKLKDVNRITRDISFTMLGDDRVRAGRVINVDNEHIGLKGQYLITEADHTYSNGIHRVNVTLGEI